ncbi:MAG TPA: transglutaminaseTgpA domain-containing protein, partial [Nocardioidaceae bacterium]|nr:transglutaminaseTgpA domain-containing protein [Nocardioidaceae bacterium]
TEQSLRPEINALAVLVLALLALFTFDRSFGDRGYLVPGLVGIAFPLAAAVLCHRSGAGVARFSFVAYGAFLPLAAWCAFGSPLRIAEVFGVTKEAPKILLSTVPPADTAGAVLVLPFVLAYVAGALGGWLAMKSSQPLAPAIPLVAVLVLSVLFGTEETQAVMVKSVLFVAVLLLWLAYRSVSDPDVLHAARGAAPRAAGTLLVVGALVLGSTVLVGDVGDRLVLRGLLGSGYDVSDTDNPLTDIKRYTNPDAPGSLSDKRLLTVTGLGQETRMRFTVLDRFDGEQWQAGNDNVDGTREDRYQEVASQIGTNAEGRSLNAIVDIGPAWSSDWLPTAGFLTSIRFTREDRVADVRYNPVAGAATMVGGLDAKDDYRFTAVAPPSDLPANSAPYDNDGDLQPTGAFLDDFLEPFRDPQLSAMEQALLLAEYLKATGQEPLPRKVFGGSDGFVPAVALASARLGVPARVVVGARAGTDGVVKGSDVEAWVELRIADGSWRSLPTDVLTVERVPDKDRQSPEEFLKQKQPEPQDGSGSDDTGEDDLSSESGGLPWRVVLIVVTLGLAVGVLPALKLVRRRRRRSAAGPDSAVGAWRDLVDGALDLGWDAPSGTRPLQAAGWADAAESATTASLAVQVDDLLFGGETPTAAELEHIWSVSDKVRGAWRADAPLGRRVWAWWNPASLVASLRRRRGPRSP